MAESSSFLSRDQLTSVKNLFLLNLGNRDFLLGTKKRHPGAPTLIAPLFFLILAAILCGCPLAGAAGTPDGQNLIIGLIVIIGLPCLIGTVLTYRAYRRARRLDEEGQLLQGTITAVSTRERSQAANLFLLLLMIGTFILDLISIFDSSSTRTSSTIGYTPGDFYELTVQFSAATPSGQQISGTAKRNRPDLRENGLPMEGDPIVILYRNDAQYKLM